MSDGMGDEEQFRMSHAGLLARSAEGHAAKGMRIKDQEDMWVEIQHHTFRNWVNVQLRDTGLKVDNLSEDLRDGLALVTLVEVLQKRRLRKVKRVMNQHQALENVTTALNAIAEDGIKLVNIGNVDIVNGNLKLILGLIWSLIMHYQIGQSKFPPKKLMLTWLRAVLPDCRIQNFTSDWNSGVYLSALLDYCKPGLFTTWKNLNPRNSIPNCKQAMEIAKAEFNIPMILEPEILASPYLDELSGMTYLSYFMKEGGPGYKATLDWVRKQLPNRKINNFTTDWNDGMNLTTLVKQLGGPVPGFKRLRPDPDSWESNLQLGIDGGRKLGVEPVLSASEMSRPDVESLANMGYIAYYQWVRPRQSPADSLAVKCDLDNVRVNNPVPFKIDFLTKEVVLSEIKVQVQGPTGPVRVDLDLSPRGGKGVFVPDEVGIYELTVLSEDEVVEGCPVKVRALPDVSKIMFSGIDPCALGSIVEVVINSNGVGGGDIDVTAYSPTGRGLVCPVKVDDGVYAATFQPDEAGEWSIAVTYDEEHIQGSPFTCHVYDPHSLKIRELDKGPSSVPGRPFTFVVDATRCGWGDATVDVTQGGRSIPSRSLEIDRGLYEVTFTPLEAAKHKIYAYFNGHEVKGSPFSLYLGIERPPDRKDSKSRKKTSSKETKTSKDVKEVVKEYSGSSLLNSPRYSSSSNDSPYKSSNLSKTYDSNTQSKAYETGNRSVNSSITKNSLEKTYDSKYDPPSKAFDSSVSKGNSSYEAINNKYVNFESSTIVSRSSAFDSSKKHSSSYDAPHSKITHEDSLSKKGYEMPTSARKSLTFESSPATSPTRISSYSKSSALDSSYNSSFDSSFNTSTSTVINTNKSTFNKAASPTRLSSPRKSTSPSPPPTLPPAVPRTGRAVSPPAGPPNALTGLSSPAKVLQIAQNAAKTSEAGRRMRDSSASFVTSSSSSSGKYRTSRTLIASRDRPDVLEDPGVELAASVRLLTPSSRVSSEPRIPLAQSDDHFDIADSSYANVSVGANTSSAITTTTIRRSEENLLTTADHRMTSSALHPVSERRSGGVAIENEHVYTIEGDNNAMAASRLPVQGMESITYLSSSTTSVDVGDAVSHRLQSSSSTSFNQQEKHRHPHSSIDPSRVTVSGPGVRLVSVRSQAEFTVSTPQPLHQEEVNVKITGPGKRHVPLALNQMAEGEVMAAFTPQQVGEYIVDVRIKDTRIPGSPFRCYVYDSQEIRVGTIPNGIVGRPVEFEIDGSTAGSGNLEILVNGGHVTSYVRNLGQQRFLASFVPHSAIRHMVEMRFNGEKVPVILARDIGGPGSSSRDVA
ncbi:filamin-C-like [Penaeus chinensis]|uniref:filamin-C-like n=1 Tax=Penaeus chinensis TaxID=139456 RepID=UPI001FB84AD1|nr:filamin-C-like [Penaeus chinensis]